MRSGKFESWAPLLLLGRSVANKTIGILGLGRIGYAVAQRATGFNMKILYNGRSRKEEAEEKLGAEFVDKETLLKESDFVVLLAPLTEETRHMVGADELEMMKDTAYLLNIGRGPLVDEKALVAALSNGKIAGAGLDVFEEEPKMAEGLAELDNVVIVPHIGSATIETREEMGNLVMDNVEAFAKGEGLKTCLNE
eukprot:TRINITY_DN916_c0_g1_i9.p3 TRINITY_DN916_c0_g1~~TRINITY_DN916_c0_g1_i9.p3  ORF type:complete len:195 (+),score=65.94 TRINITY_DN916_c0_g1_i9:984-1568(+)